jgi:hypothetical protein
MDAPSYTHVLRDSDSGEAVGAIRDIDETPDGALFGVVRRFDLDEPETYIWLEGLDVIRLADAAAHVRNHVTWALAQAAPA